MSRWNNPGDKHINQQIDTRKKQEHRRSSPENNFWFWSTPDIQSRVNKNKTTIRAKMYNSLSGVKAKEQKQPESQQKQTEAIGPRALVPFREHRCLEGQQFKV